MDIGGAFNVHESCENMDPKIAELATLIDERNAIASQITNVIGRPAQIGHIGEFIASRIFDIQLEDSAVSKGIDGIFCSGQLAGQAVNVKFYAKREGLLDIRLDAVAEYYLVLAGPRPTSMSSRNEVRPWKIDWVFLFHGPTLVEHLQQRGVKIGVATSVVKAQWNNAEIYPNRTNPDYIVSSEQRDMLRLFGSTVRVPKGIQRRHNRISHSIR